MDSREQPPQHSNVMVGPTSYPPNTTLPSTMATATTVTAPFPFTSMPHHHPTAPSSYEDSSSSALKKKRGRPRKYSPNAGNIALGLAPSTDQHVSSPPPPPGGSATPSTEPLAKKHRGRPPGSGKKQLDALGAGGTGFTPHVILVEPGEDIAAKFVEFSQQGPRTVCILSARGAISNVTLRQSTTSGCTVTHEGLFEIISLSSSALPSEKSSGDGKMDGLSVSLAGPDGRVLGGIVAGILKAASQVQVIVGSFIAEHKKSRSDNLKSGPSEPSPQTLTSGAPATPTSPTSQGPSSDSSDDNDNGPSNRGPDLYNNATQPIHNMPLHHHRLWAQQ
ncbi:hypothetical protein Lal_00007632 [Lupinus albus]|uniref:AT-hook motif nuclear-localized protein n=1 Tax=Lupinus albus TaxID=3870 RepID=A0A6A4P9X8_LUPAL|nr:putative PPC domain-containing protein [Lupinus albus]KAF1875016.1 hypothetical protein Lal_00007632 [Lupinus albus]